MKIVVVGTRGIPNILGGVETHCEELFPRIAEMGHDVTVIRRSCYVKPDNKITEYKGVHLVDVYAPHQKSIEALVHTFLAILKARRLNPDIIHFHAVGPSVEVPIARMLGMKVVMTNHGPDYDRKKWGKLAKTLLKLGERFSTNWSNEVIVISHVIDDILRRKYGRNDCNLIYNGVETPVKSQNTDYTESLGLKPKHYVVGLARFVKEKGLDLLIDAFVASNHGDFKLVLAGDADHEDEYADGLKAKAKANGVVLTGFIRGEKLNQIMTNAALFVLPSFHEGLPISLLEAMSYNLDVIVSDIPANKLNCLETDDFFKCGDVNALREKLNSKFEHLSLDRVFDLRPYNWDKIAEQTVEVYRKCLKTDKH